MEVKPNRLLYFVIAEAHCLSLHSHEYNPLYQKLIELRQKCPNVPIVAITSTATKQVFYKNNVFMIQIHFILICV